MHEAVPPEYERVVVRLHDGRRARRADVREDAARRGVAAYVDERRVRQPALQQHVVRSAIAHA